MGDEERQADSGAVRPELLARLPVLRLHGLDGALTESDHPLDTNNEVASAAAWFVVERQVPGSLVEMLPALADFGSEPIAMGQLRTRTRNVLLEREWLTWSTIENLSVEEILAIPKSGKKTAWDIVKAAIFCVLELSSSVSASGTRDAYTLFLRVLGEGARSGAGTVGEALVAVREGHPDLWAELVSAPLADPPEPPEENASFGQLLSTLPERQQTILLHRSERTLEELGADFDITRERIRQLEDRAVKSLRTTLDEQRFTRLRTSMAAVSDAVLSAAPLDNHHVASVYGELLQHAAVDPSHGRELRLLLRMAGPLELIDGAWLLAEDWDASAADEVIRSVVSTRIVSLQEAVEKTRSLRLRDDVVARLISAHPDTRQIDDQHWVRWTGSVVDKADVVLHLLGRPATIEELLEHIGEDRSERTLSNGMSEDDRFVRVDRATFGLSEWGLPAYEGIAREVEKRLLASPTGRLSMAELVEELSSFAAPASVRAYCRVPRFVVEGGTVWIRRPEDGPFRMPKHTSRAKGLFHHEGRGAMTIAVTVDRELMRGSGLGVGSGIASAVGVLPGQPRTWGRGGETVSVAWDEMSPTPQLSSLRSVALSLGAEEGDALFVMLPGDSDEFDAFVEADLTTSRFGAVNGMLSDLAACLACGESEVVRKLERRGDDQVVVSALLAQLGERQSPS